MHEKWTRHEGDIMKQRETNLSNFVGSFFGRKVSEAYNIDNLSEEDKENRHRGTMNTRPNRSNTHQNAVVPISKGEQLQKRNLSFLLSPI